MWISFNKLIQYCGRWTKMYGCMAMHQNPPKPLWSPFWVADFHGCSSKTTYNILGTIGFEWFWPIPQANCHNPVAAHLSPRNVWTWTRHFLAGDAPTLGLWIHRISAWCFRWRAHSFKCVFLTTTRPSVDSNGFHGELMICQTLPKSSKITFRKYLKIDNPIFWSHMIDWKSTNHKSMWHCMVLVLLFEHPVSKKKCLMIHFRINKIAIGVYTLFSDTRNYPGISGCWF